MQAGLRPLAGRTLPPDAVGSSPVSEVTRAVIVPLPASGRCTK